MPSHSSAGSPFPPARSRASRAMSILSWQWPMMRLQKACSPSCGPMAMPSSQPSNNSLPSVSRPLGWHRRQRATTSSSSISSSPRRASRSRSPRVPRRSRCCPGSSFPSRASAILWRSRLLCTRRRCAATRRGRPAGAVFHRRGGRPGARSRHRQVDRTPRLRPRSRPGRGARRAAGRHHGTPVFNRPAPLPPPARPEATRCPKTCTAAARARPSRRRRASCAPRRRRPRGALRRELANMGGGRRRPRSLDRSPAARASGPSSSASCR